MNWNEYLRLSEKTLSQEFHCNEQKYKNILHSVLGILSEIEEIFENYKNGKLITEVSSQGSLGEEIADLAWYLAIPFRELDLDSQNIQLQIHSGNSYETLHDILMTSIKFVDPLKKKIFYNKPIDDQMLSDLSYRLLSLIINYSNINSVDFNMALEKNIAKLKARYGEKFSSEKAINRDLAVEKNILEN